MKLYSSTLCFGFLVIFVCQQAKELAISEYCQTARIIVASRLDTADTLTQIRRENAKVRKLCPAK